jgi:preprotein translocase subunit YajC
VIDIFTSVLAQTGAKPQQQQAFDPTFMIGITLVIIVFYAFMLSGSRKQKKERQSMLANVKKNDRVLTIGGVIGTVVNIKEGEITLKVDETNNVKMTVVRGAIQRVLGEGETPSDVP